MWNAIIAWMLSGNVGAKVGVVATTSLVTVIGVPATVVILAANAKFDDLDKKIDQVNISTVKEAVAKDLLTNQRIGHLESDVGDIKVVVERIDKRVYDMHTDFKNR